jgi:AcrR family transcriptional regulator
MARRLRVEHGLTVDQLAQRLALPRSTIYYWVRDLPLREGRAAAAARAGVEKPPRRGRQVSRAGSDAAYREALATFDELAAQPTFRDFLCLYIAQGNKCDRTRVELSNSDPAVMRLVNRWIRRLTDRVPFVSLQYPSDQSLTELRRFWSEAVGAEARAIRVRGTVPGEAAPEQAQPEARHGVLTVAVDDTLLRARLQGWMQRTREGWM